MKQRQRKRHGMHHRYNRKSDAEEIKKRHTAIEASAREPQRDPAESFDIRREGRERPTLIVIEREEARAGGSN